MINYILLSIASTVALLITSNVHAESLFGIEIGGAFSVRECTADDLVQGKNIDKGLCTRSKGVALTQHPWGATTHQIEQPFGMHFASWGFQPYGFNVKEFQGKVIEISIATFGADWQEEAMHDLVTKFGKPPAIKKSIMQNTFGVKVEKLSAKWKKAGYTVFFDGISGSTDTGFITIKTDDAILEEHAADQWRSKNLPQPKM
ncbi:MAG: hypothetical protein WA142_10210 [Rugosibacter sp.]